VGRVAQHVAALAQRVENQRHVHLLEIADAAVHKLGTAAGGFFRENLPLHQQGAIAARRGLNGSAEASGPAANHQYVHGGELPPSSFRISLRLLTPVCSFLGYQSVESNPIRGTPQFTAWMRCEAWQAHSLESI